MRVGILVTGEGDIEGKIRKVKSVGFDFGQISVWDMSLHSEEYAQKIKAICAANNFEVTSLWCGWSGPVDWTYPGMYSTLGLVPAWLRERRMNDLMDGADLGRLLGIRDIVTHIGYIPDNPFDENYIGITEALTVIGTKLKRNGQRLLFETGEELPVTLIQMIKATGLDNLGVNLDPANLTMSGRANAVEALIYFMPYLMNMHAKDGLRPADGEPSGVEVPIGRGHANFPELIRILKENRYDGEIVIEREGVAEDVWEEDVVMAKAYLEGLIAK